MRHTMVTYTVKSGREEENTALVRAVFDELAQTRPDGFRYAVFHFPDTRQFVHIYTDEGNTSGVQELPSFQAFVTGADERHERSATFTRPELIGDYRTFNDPGDPATAAGPVPATVGAVRESGGAQTDKGGGQ